jgi:hypothetical protein
LSFGIFISVGKCKISGKVHGVGPAGIGSSSLLHEFKTSAAIIKNRKEIKTENILVLLFGCLSAKLFK